MLSATSLIIISGFFIFGCTKNPIVAKVNGEAITQKDIDVLLTHSRIKEEGKISPQKSDLYRTMRRGLLNHLINERLMLQAAKKENIKVVKKEVMNAYSNIVSSFPKEEDYLKKIKERGMSRDIVLKSIERDLTIRKFKDSLSRNLAISEGELKDYYSKNLQASFPSEMAKEIKKIKTGDFGGPIKGREGYYLIKVQDRKEKRVAPFDEVRENIKHLLIEQKKEERLQSWLQEAKKKAKIEIFD